MQSEVCNRCIINELHDLKFSVTYIHIHILVYNVFRVIFCNLSSDVSNLDVASYVPLLLPLQRFEIFEGAAGLI